MLLLCLPNGKLSLLGVIICIFRDNYGTKSFLWCHSQLCNKGTHSKLARCWLQDERMPSLPPAGSKCQVGTILCRQTLFNFNRLPPISAVTYFISYPVHIQEKDDTLSWSHRVYCYLGADSTWGRTALLLRMLCLLLQTQNHSMAGVEGPSGSPWSHSCSSMDSRAGGSGPHFHGFWTSPRRGPTAFGQPVPAPAQHRNANQFAPGAACPGPLFSALSL